ncbi:MAG: response regulator [bacterium]|nr:response regulator [bacterium]
MTKGKIIKILSVEDDEFMRIFLRDVFWIHGGEGFEMLMARNISEARDFLGKDTPDIIFLDMVLPDREGGELSAKNGLGFLDEIKSNPALKGINVIVFSGYTDADAKKIALKKGADLFLVKGEHLPKELVDATEKMLRK